MNAKELIEVLEKMDPEMTVIVPTGMDWLPVVEVKERRASISTIGFYYTVSAPLKGEESVIALSPSFSDE